MNTRFGARDGTWRLLRLRLACWWLADRRLATVPGSPLLAKNSPQDCFLTLRPSRVQAPRKIKKSRCCDSSLFGARDGTWTRTGLPHAPQTCASADSATLAFNCRSLKERLILYQIHFCLSTVFEINLGLFHNYFLKTFRQRSSRRKWFYFAVKKQFFILTA